MKVSIIGGGGLVGSCAAYALQCGGVVREIALLDINEELAAKFPIRDEPSFDMHWGNLRRRDGTVTKP